jgi:hypothetical protein
VQIGEPSAVCAGYAVLRNTALKSRNSSDILEEIILLNSANQPSPNLMQGTPLKFRVIVVPPEDQGIISLILRDVHDSVLFELFDPQFSLSKANGMNIVVDIDAGKLLY